MLVNLIAAFYLRFILSFLSGLSFDMGAWFGWAERLVKLPWGEFYSKEIWTNYTPGYFYILYLLRRFELLLKNLFLIELSGIGREVLFKFPANLADIATGILIYKILKKQSHKIAILASAFYLFNIAIIFNSSVWGQADSVMTLLLFLSVYLFLNKKTVFSSLSYALAFLVNKRRIKHAIYNIVQNAIGYSQAGGTISITASGDKARIILKVSDTGIGISSEDQDSIFDRFQRGRNPGQLAQGAGLGLALVKSFVEVHGGTVKLQSEPGKGTTVTVVLPRNPIAGDAPGDPPEGGGSDDAGNHGPGIISLHKRRRA